MYIAWGKRVFDFLLAMLLIVLTSPIVIVATIGLFFANRGKPFFFQIRPGYLGKPFRLIKFKTMRDEFDNTGNPLSDEKRITTIGQFIRSSSIDELPQLWNVLKGDMSIVGPRPLLMEYLPLYNEVQARRHSVKPGITGWAQVNGRNTISWDEKFNFDIWYVDNISFSLDARIVMMSIAKVVSRRGIDNSKGVPMPKFTGDKD